MKTVRYSYLLNNERSLLHALGKGTSALLHKSVAAAKRGRHWDCYDGENKPGNIVKITLEALNK